MRSNKLCENTNLIGEELHREISERRWLPKQSGVFKSKNYLYFYEYSNPINFQNQFLNLISAIREWDLSLKE